jgi:predicted negative regulator of RcsB-dependent stress response
VDRITRKELKADNFALEIGQTVTFLDQHRQDIIRYGGIALAAVVLIGGYLLYSGRQHSKRQEALFRAIQVEEAPVGPPTPGQNRNFPTQDVKDDVALRAFTDLTASYPGTQEGEIGQYYIGAIKADQGKLAEAEKAFKEVADKADDKYASLAKLSLAQIYFADGRDQQGEALLRDLIAHPTPFVSKEQATITLARYLAPKNPAEAKKLLDPLRSLPGTIGQTALMAYSELPQ